MIDYDKFQKSLRHLHLQYANNLQAKKRRELTKIDREAIGESVVQRFETCYDAAWKDLKRYLIEEIGLPDVPNSPKPVIKLAGQNDLLGRSIDRWLEYADARTSTSHDYSGKKASAVITLTGEFIDDAIALFERMTGRTWK